MGARAAVFCLSAALALASAEGAGEGAAARRVEDCMPERRRGPDVVEWRCGAPSDPGLRDHLVARDLSLYARVPAGCALAISLRVAAEGPAARLSLDAERAAVVGGPALALPRGEVSISLSGAHLELAAGEAGARTRASRLASVADRAGRIQVGTHGNCEDAWLVFERIGS